MNDKKDKKELNDEFELDKEDYDLTEEDSYETNEEPLVEDNSISEQIFKINVRIQEIDGILERYEDALYTRDEEILTEEEVDNLKEEYRILTKQRKELLKQRKESIWDHMPIWMAFYAIFQLVFSFYIILTQTSAYFAEWLYSVFAPVPIWLLYAFLFVVPFLSLMLSLTIYFLLKDKKQKRLFMYIYLVQIFQTLISVGILIFIMV